MKIIKNTLNIGLKKPYTFMHISDTHLTLADSRDNIKKSVLSKVRSRVFPHGLKNLEECEAYAQQNKFLTVHTGDLIDFVSAANLDRASDFTFYNDVFMTAGNHEFSLYVGEAKEDEAYRNQSLPFVQRSFRNDIRFSVRSFPEWNLIGIDNSYYLFDENQYNRLKTALSDKKPAVLCMHTPLYEEKLFISSMSKNPCAYLCGVPEKFMTDYPRNRFLQQKADGITLKTIDLIKSSENVRAVLSGHMHFDYESRLTPDIFQFVTGKDTMRIITLK